MESTATAPSPHEAPQPQSPPPMMDVVPPHVPPSETAASSSEPVAVRQAPPIEDTDSDPEVKTPAAKTPKDPPKSPSKRPAPAKKPGNSSGAGLAIAATVIIVLGLAALATYAFLKTQK